MFLSKFSKMFTFKVFPLVSVRLGSVFESRVMRDAFNWISFLQICCLFEEDWGRIAATEITTGKGGVKTSEHGRAQLCFPLLTAQIPMGTLSYIVLKLWLWPARPQRRSFPHSQQAVMCALSSDRGRRETSSFIGQWPAAYIVQSRDQSESSDKGQSTALL